jgi:vitamin B12 transporter
MKNIIYILFLLFPILCGGQIDSVHKLNDIIVVGPKLDAIQIGKILHSVDSAKLYNQNFGMLHQNLAAHSNVFVKNYGLNNLSSLSVRGSNASQVATLWNGFNLNMLSQSQIDMNLIPSFFVDKLSVEYGASASKNGSGAIGATVHLQSSLPMRAGYMLQVGQQISSFSAFATTAKYYFSNAKFASSTKIIYNDAQNNFLFYPGGSILFAKEKMENNKSNQVGVLQENKWMMDKRHTLNAGIWWQETNRQLPPSSTSVNTKETQADRHTRFYAHCNGNYGRYLHNAKFVASKEYLRYTNPVLSIDNDYLTNRIMLESEHIYTNKIGVFSATAQYNYGQMISEKYTSDASQNRWSAQMSFAKQWMKNKLQTGLTARQELVNKQMIPLTYSINASYQLLRCVKLNSVFNTMYRLPTFNDLFWAGAGNPDLKSEQGIGADFGILFQYNAKDKWKTNSSSTSKINQLEIGVTAYTRKVDNWIIWTPSSTNIWRPQNVLQVWSRGVELSAHYAMQIKHTDFSVDANYAFSKSTNEKVNTAMNNALHQQLIYTPLHTANANVAMLYNNWQAIYQPQIIGQRFTSSDNENQLPNYMIQNVQIRKTILSSQKQCTIGAGINNISNQNYQVIAYRPMPLRNYFLSLQLQLRKTPSSKIIQKK